MVALAETERRRAALHERGISSDMMECARQMALIVGVALDAVESMGRKRLSDMLFTRAPLQHPSHR